MFHSAIGSWHFWWLHDIHNALGNDIFCVFFLLSCKKKRCENSVRKMLPFYLGMTVLKKKSRSIFKLISYQPGGRQCDDHLVAINWSIILMSYLSLQSHCHLNHIKLESLKRSVYRCLVLNWDSVTSESLKSPVYRWLYWILRWLSNALITTAQ